MQGRKPLRQLRAKQGEGGHAAEGGQVARPRIVSYERSRTIRQRQQIGDRAGGGHFLLPGFKPPVLLVWIAGDLHAIILWARPGYGRAKTTQGPDAPRLAR